jgi:ankyrin repeat protein
LLIHPQHPSLPHLNARDKNGDTPVMLAVKKGNLAIVEELCEQPGIDLSLVNNDGLTALRMAEVAGYGGKMLELLRGGDDRGPA